MVNQMISRGSYHSFVSYGAFDRLSMTTCNILPNSHHLGSNLQIATQLEDQSWLTVNNVVCMLHFKTKPESLITNAMQYCNIV